MLGYFVAFFVGKGFTGKLYVGWQSIETDRLIIFDDGITIKMS